jgi:hypothetical protein
VSLFVNVIMMSVVIAECLYAECSYAECRGAPDPTFDQNAEGKLENILTKREEM